MNTAIEALEAEGIGDLVKNPDGTYSEVNQTVDMMSEPCTESGCEGIFTETSINDDWDGVLHCSKCGESTPRYVKEN